MAGALAWQVNKINKKEKFFGSRGETAWGFFLAQGLFPSVSCVLALLLYLLVLRSSKPIQTNLGFWTTSATPKVSSAYVHYFPLIRALVIYI